jgi:putative ABC transport system substrate-binding protein
MRRRDFVSLVGGAAAWPLAARAQQGERMRRIGVLAFGSPTDSILQTYLNAFREGLQNLGWQEGRNVAFEYRWAGYDSAAYDGFATELVGRSPDVIICNTTNATVALKRATSTIPIVFVGVSDPVSAGIVSSLARPGGNLTGFSHFEYAIGGKWLQLLKDAVPRIARVGVLINPLDDSHPRYLRAIEPLAPALGIEIVQVVARETGAIEPSIDAFARGAGGGLLGLSSFILNNNRDRVVARANLHRLPAIYAVRSLSVAGGLMSYGPDPVDQHARAAVYVDRILRGAKPADLPVQQPTKFEFIINLRTAKALDLSIPPGVLAIVDEVIE